MHVTRALAVFLLLAGAAGATPAVVDNPPLFSVRGQVRALRAADFNSDGKLDFAALTWDSWASEAAVTVFRGNGDGTFAPAQRTVLPRSALFMDVALLDGDAFPDLMIAGGSDGPPTLRMVHGNGDGTFAAPGAEIPAEWCSSGLTLADMTGDGRADVVCGRTVFRNLGGGAFGSPLTPAPSPRGFVVDANGDGKRDVVLQEWPEARLYLGNGNGTFGGAIALPVRSDDRTVMAMANFDGSGWADYAFVNETLSTGLAGAGGEYGLPVVRGPVRASAMATPDLNGDGRPDLVAGGAHQLSTWIMGAGGVPGPRTVYATAGEASVLVTGDFDADGSVDVLAGGDGDAFSDHDTVSLLRGSPGGALLAMRVYAVTGQWSDGRFFGGAPTGAAVSDVTGDGIPDLLTVASRIPAIAVFAGRGDGTFHDAPQLTAVPSASWPAPAFADLDDDGALDVILSDQSQFHCFVANGDGTYRHAVTFVGNAGNDPAYGTGDFDGDGHTDFVQEYAGTLTFRAGRGDGTFDAPVARAYGTSWDGFRVGDVNGDGRDDLVFSGDVLLGTPSGIFTVLAHGAAVSSDPPAAVVDLDADGKLDLVHVTTYAPENVQVLKGNGDGTFGAPRAVSFPNEKPGPRDLRVTSTGDFNGDRHADVAFGPTILLGDGTGLFNGYARVRDPAANAECGAGDVDRNGTLDLLCTSFDTDSLAVFRTRTAESLDLPLALAIETVPATAPAGEWLRVTVRATTSTGLAPSGAVLLAIGGQITGIAELVDGVGHAEVWPGLVGSQALTARFGGDDVYAAADAPPRQIELSKAKTYFSQVWRTPYEPVTNKEVRFVGEVWSGLPRPQGTVKLFIDGVLVGTAEAPAFDFVVAPLPEGRRVGRLEYSGSASHLATTISFVFHVVKPLIAMNVTADPPNGAIVGAPVTITVTFPEEPQLTGNVTIYGADGKGYTLPVSGGVATLTTTTLAQGSALRVSFAGNSVYRPTEQSVSYTVSDAPVPPGPSSFYLVTPCRVVDTRESSSPVAAGATRSVTMARRCGVPYGARAVAVNLTVVNPLGTGYLTLYPAADPRPYTSTLNYRPGKTRANSAVLPLSAGGLLKVYNGGAANAHVIVDVTGYFQ